MEPSELEKSAAQALGNGDLYSAELLYLDLIDSKSKIVPANDPGLGQLFEKLALALERQGKESKAFRLLAKMAQLNGEADSDCAEVG